ncbi:MAG: DoxX family membrane protein [Anaerolineales bacterium]|nr:DoxX family membrane protein [Anaerolineales bacterium]
MWSWFWETFDRVDRTITHWMARSGVVLLRISLGINFLWFGVLKFFPGMSPAQDLATDTISLLTFRLLEPNPSITILAIWETAIGLGLIAGVGLRVVLLLLFMQMLGTLTPLVLFPELTFTSFPIAPTLEGQYIVKNLVLISAGIVVGATVRGGRLVETSEVENPHTSGLGPVREPTS